MKKIFAYQHNIEKYRRDTGDLSLEQHGAYRTLMDEFYLTGGFLPAEKKSLYRLAKAQNLHERRAIDFIVARYWRDRGDGYLTQKMAENELERISKVASENSEKRKAQLSKNKELQELTAQLQPCQPITINQKEERESVAGVKISPLELSMEFEIFWNEYPKQVGKNEARRQYQTARESGVTHATIIDGVKRYIAIAATTEQRFIPNPGKWLNDGRWDDRQSPDDATAAPRAAQGRGTYADSIRDAGEAALHNIRRQEDVRKEMGQ